MPEEYRLWKERVDAVEKKKHPEPPATTTLPVLPPPASSTAPESLLGADQVELHANGAAEEQQQHQHQEMNSNGAAANAVRGKDSEENMLILQSSLQQTSAVMQPQALPQQPQAVAQLPPVVVAAPVYATHADAVDAFKAMLEEHDVTAVMKMKEVTDLCQKDVRFNALKGGGEKKQALAEYQVINDLHRQTNVHFVYIRTNIHPCIHYIHDSAVHDFPPEPFLNYFRFVYFANLLLWTN